MAKANLQKFLDEALFDSTKGAPPSAISLTHVVGMHGQPKEVQTFKLGQSEDLDTKMLAQRFRAQAEAYAAELIGVQMFQLCVFYGESIEPGAFQPFQVNVTADPNTLYTEGPNQMGAQQQSMRHQEMIFQQTYRKQAHLDEMQIRMFELLTRENAMLRRDNMESFVIVKDLLMERSLGDHNREMERQKFERQTKEREKWISYLPALVNTVVGQEIFPQSSEDTVLIEGIANNLTEEHIQMLSALNLPAELMGPLAGRIAKAKAKKEAEITHIRQLPRPKLSGLDDVTAGNDDEEEDSNERSKQAR